MRRNSTSIKTLWAGGVLGLMICQSALAGGFGLRVQSAASVGTAYSVDGVGTFDPSGIYANPAVISAFKGQNISVGVSRIQDSISFSDGARSLPGTGGLPANDPNTSASGIATPATIPLLFGVHQVNDSVNVGWSLTAPWGTETTYNDTWVGRYNGTSTSLAVLNADLGVSYKLNDQLSFGVGIQVQQANGKIAAQADGGALAVQGASAQLTSALKAKAAGDNGAAFQQLSGLAKQMGAAFQTAYATAATAAASGGAAAAAAAGAAAGAAAAKQAGNVAYAQLEGKNDIEAEYKAKTDLAYGFNMGVLYTPIPDLKLGLSYRSKVKHKDKGTVKFTPSTPTAAAVQLADAASGTDKLLSSDAEMTITLPDVYVLGAAYNLNPAITLFGNVTYTKWSTIQVLNITYANDNDIIARLNWKDVMAESIGAAYQLNTNVVLRAGLGYDQTPTNNQYRSPRTPEDNKTIVSLGVGYKADKWQVDAGLAHEIIPNPKLNLNEGDYPSAMGRGNLTGTYKVNADILTVQYAMNF